jgi:hypothetical protein
MQKFCQTKSSTAQALRRCGQATHIAAIALVVVKHDCLEGHSEAESSWLILDTKKKKTAGHWIAQAMAENETTGLSNTFLKFIGGDLPVLSLKVCHLLMILLKRGGTTAIGFHCVLVWQTCLVKKDWTAARNKLTCS